MLTVLLAFIEGLALMLSPCILPILPLILAGSLVGNIYKPYGIMCGFVLLFTCFTLFSRLIVKLLPIDPSLIRNIALIILFLMGVILISSSLYNLFTKLSAQTSQWLVGKKLIKNEGGFWNGVLIGGLLGILWTPCAGPILAAVIVQTILQQTHWMSVMVTAAFALGAALPMLLIALVGRRISQQFVIFRLHAVLIRKLLGIILIIGTIALYYQNWFALYASRYTPLIGGSASRTSQPYPAPPIQGISAWINSPPLTLNDLKGKVILIDFWTYSCINCIRTLPYLKDWYQKYHPLGLIIIGIHSPEFPFEQKLTNVQQAVKMYGIEYPVALDNQFVTWRNYHNAYWPAHYLIDKAGNVIDQQWGEGHYADTENKIRQLLGLSALPMADLNQPSMWGETPETYLGYQRADTFSSKEPVKIDEPFYYHYPHALLPDHWALAGNWIIQKDKIISVKNYATIKLNFKAKHVYAVMGSKVGPILVNVVLNDKPLNDQNGNDVKKSQLIVQANRLYEILNLTTFQSGILELRTSTPGLELYTFTFGN